MHGHGVARFAVAEDGSGAARSALFPPLGSAEGRPVLVCAAAFLAAALAFGGGGSPAPIGELIVQLAAVAAVGALLVREPRSLRAPPRPLLLIAAGWIALHLLQLVPLPPSLWRALPGREALVAAREAVGAADGWWPLSTVPLRTIQSLLSLVAPLAGLLLFGSLDARSRRALLLLVVAVAVVGGVLGVYQVLTDGGWIYGRPVEGYATGLVANRNAFADFLLIALLALACWHHGAEGVRASDRLVVGCVALFLAACVLISGSRTGSLLLLVPAGVAAALWLGRRRVSGSGWGMGGWAAGVVAAALALAAGYAALSDGAVAGRVFDRFEQTGDHRLSAIWPDAAFAARAAWSAGAGMGAFVSAFEGAERLEVVDDSDPNRAHMDYLELAIEAGAPGLLLLVATGAVLLGRAVSNLRRPSDRAVRAEDWFAAGVLVIIALHSLVDYPIRCMTLAVLGALAAAMIFGDRAGGLRDRVLGPSTGQDAPADRGRGRL